jgi:hypothetical protein
MAASYYANLVEESETTTIKFQASMLTHMDFLDTLASITILFIQPCDRRVCTCYESEESAAGFSIVFRCLLHA